MKKHVPLHQTYRPKCCLKLVFQKNDQHTGGKRLIHVTKHCTDNQLQSLEFPCKIV